jgi:hypothetical protein
MSIAARLALNHPRTACAPQRKPLQGLHAVCYPIGAMPHAGPHAPVRYCYSHHQHCYSHHQHLGHCYSHHQRSAGNQSRKKHHAQIILLALAQKRFECCTRAIAFNRIRRAMGHLQCAESNNRFWFSNRPAQLAHMYVTCKVSHTRQPLSTHGLRTHVAPDCKLHAAPKNLYLPHIKIQLP